TIPDEAAVDTARDLRQRDFTATGANEKWVCDITYLRTCTGFLYLAFVLDCYSRMIVGWQLATHMHTDLVLDALDMANGLRRPGEGLIAHSDRGSQGGFNRSSQRSTEGSCDEREEAEVGSGWSAGDAVAGASAGRTSGAPS